MHWDGSSLKGVLHGNFKGDIKYHEVPMEETLLSPVGVTRVVVSTTPSTAMGEGSTTTVESSLLHRFSRGPTAKGSSVDGGWVTLKRMTSVDSAPADGVGANINGKRMHKR